MLFNSFEFIFGFLPVTLLAYWLLRRADLIFLANLSLLVGSLVFYYFGEKNYPLLILLSIAFNYAMGRLISSGAAPGRLALAAGITVDLLTLSYFKYSNFLVENIRHFAPSLPPMHHVELPIGISFFTFTQIAYLVDCHLKKAKDYELTSYGLFVTFFPHLIAGPILHHSEMMPQFMTRTLGRIGEHLSAGLGMFAIGLFKKTVVADSVASVATELFGDAMRGHDPTLLPAWVAALGYTVQIYFDFSGYSDMAIGLARMFGIDLPVNFNSPYKARSIADFWRRWHITLSRFLRDYLYIPLGGNRTGKARRYLNLIITMVLGGLWHGAAWNFVLWGAIHGVFLAIELLFIQAWKLSRIPLKTPAGFGRIGTLAIVIFAWVPFRAADLSTTLRIWRGMLGCNGAVLPVEWPMIPKLAMKLGLPTGYIDIHPLMILTILAALVVTLTLPNSQQLMRRFALGLDSPGYDALRAGPTGWETRRSLFWAALLGVTLGVALVYIGGYSEFIYFQF